MKLFWYNFELTKKSFLPTTSYQGMNQITDIWKDLAVNLSTFYKMYRIDADIRRCIQEIQQTSWKSWYSIRKWINNRQDYKTLDIKEVSDILTPKIFNVLKNEIIQQLSISWTVFILKEKNLEGSAISFRVLDTRYMSVVTDTNYVPTKYLYTERSTAQVIQYEIDEIFCYKEVADIDNPVFWISMLESLVYDVMGDLEASKSNYYFFQNDAMPSSFYVLQEWLWEEEQQKVIDDLKAQLQGGANKHKNLVSWNVVDVKPITRSHTDMDFLEQKKHKTEKVCATLGVPRIVLNYTDWVNYSNAEVQYQKFIENTIRPTEQLIEIIMNDLLADYLGEAEFYIIDKHINDFKDKLSLAILWVQNGLMTRNEARGFTWYDTVSGDDTMDEFTVSSNTILLDAVAWGVPALPPPDTTETPTKE